MTNEFWLNLPVKDINKSREFYSKIGFSFKPSQCNPDTMAHLVVGNKNVIVNLFTESAFKGFAGNDIPNTKIATEVLFNLGAESREEVDEWAKKAECAGGSIVGRPGDSQGWLYACNFADLDVHRWNV